MLITNLTIFAKYSYNFSALLKWVGVLLGRRYQTCGSHKAHFDVKWAEPANLPLLSA